MLGQLQAKIERAEEQIRNLQVESDSFFALQPYRIVRKDDEQTGDWVCTLQVVKEIPLRFAVIVGETAHNLRSVLDHMIYHFVRTNSPTMLHRGTGFPILTNANEFPTIGKRKIQGVTAEVARIVETLKAYKGGNDALWQLNRLSVTEKHKLPVLVGSAHRNIIFDVAEPFRAMRPKETIPEMLLALKPADRQFPLKDGAELYRVLKAARAGMDMNPKFTFEVAFSEGEVFEGEPLFPCLNQLVGSVKNTVSLFSAFF